MPQATGGSGLASVVRATAEVCPRSAQLVVDLEISATNLGASDVVLKNPYLVPEAESMSNVTAHDDGGALSVAPRGQRSAVFFREGQVIESKKTYTWHVHFECPGSFHKDANRIAGVYTIKPQTQFNKMPVRCHEFKYVMRFPKPGIWLARSFKSVEVIAVPDSRIKSKIITERGMKDTELQMSFVLRNNQKMRMIIAALYHQSKVPAVIVSLIVGVVGSLIAAWLWSIL